MTTEPVNIQPELKKFLSDMATILKSKSKEFFSEGKVLLYYLEGSEKFQIDYAKHLNIQNMFSDLGDEIIPVLETRIEEKDES